MKKLVSFALFAVFATFVFGMASAAEARATETLVMAKSSVGLYESGRTDFPSLSLWVESVTKSETDLPATTSRKMDLQFTSSCTSDGCNWIYVVAEIPEGSYAADKSARTAHLFVDLADPGVRFIFGMECSGKECWSIYDFPSFLEGGFADLSWSIPSDRVNRSSGDATLSFKDICGGRGRTDASQLDGAAQMTGYAFGYPAPSLWPGHLVFRDKKTTTRSSVCGPVNMPDVVFNGGGMGVSVPASPPTLAD